MKIDLLLAIRDFCTRSLFKTNPKDKDAVAWYKSILQFVAPKSKTQQVPKK